MRNKLRRPLAFLLSAVMIVTMSGTPVHAVADRGQPETGLCEHHTAHTDDCGYTEETPGTPCGHEHTEDCYTEVTECVHEHTPECYPEETEDSVSDNEASNPRYMVFPAHFGDSGDALPERDAKETVTENDKESE